MKTITSNLLIFISIFLTSCFSSASSDEAELKRKDVLGTWKVSEEVYKNMAAENEDDDIITEFQLNTDSTVTVFFGKTMQKKMAGKWRWKVEKKVGNDAVSFSMKSDIVININDQFLLAMQVLEKEDTLKLIARNYIFEKK